MSLEVSTPPIGRLSSAEYLSGPQRPTGKKKKQIALVGTRPICPYPLIANDQLLKGC